MEAPLQERRHKWPRDEHRFGHLGLQSRHVRACYYEIAELFTLWEPEDAKSVFDNEWRPDLGTITDEFVRTVIEKIFILDPAEQPTTRKIIGFFQTLNSPAIKA